MDGPGVQVHQPDVLGQPGVLLAQEKAGGKADDVGRRGQEQLREEMKKVR